MLLFASAGWSAQPYFINFDSSRVTALLFRLGSFLDGFALARLDAQPLLGVLLLQRLVLLDLLLGGLHEILVLNGLVQ